MKLHIETLTEKELILIVSKKVTFLVEILKKELKKHGADVYFSSKIPQKLDYFSYCFYINKTGQIKITDNFPKQKTIIIYDNQLNNALKEVKKNRNKVKIINITWNNLTQDIIDRILWFSFSQNKEIFLNIKVPLIEKQNYHKQITNKKTDYLISKKKIISLFLLIILISHIIFILPLLVGSIFTYRSVLAVKKGNFSQSKNFLFSANFFLQNSKSLYSISRPTLLLLSLALLPDNLIDINEKTNIAVNSALNLYQNSQQIIKLILKNDKSSEDNTFLSLRIKKLISELNVLEENSRTLNQKIPTNINIFKSIKNQLSQTYEMTLKIKKIVPYLENILGKNQERKYLLIFANNMELRPGGGFIGSFGILTTKNFAIKDIKIYDVYDADGQLIAHVEPPVAIKKYLQQPHWFLRDSNFSPDFLDNYIQAKFFLEKEMGFNNFSGCFLITTTAIQNLLTAFGDIYLPDFNEIVNSKNFYLKTQIYAEKNFFPGSIQKKTFLSSLTKQILLNFTNVSVKTFIEQLKKSFDEKQIVVYFDDPKVQAIFDSYYWSGRLIEIKCPNNLKNCFNDFIFPVDANIGVNKANFYINRLINIKIKIDKNGYINHQLSIRFNNDSPFDAFPGGTYHNYFQVLLPKNTIIKNITKDGVLVEEYDEKNDDQFKTIGFLFDLKPKKNVEIKVDYQLETKLTEGKNIYQLIMQKQIGSANNDLIIDIQLPKNIYLINQNFSPLVKDNKIIYNTSLSTDKIFFLELIKD